MILRKAVETASAQGQDSNGLLAEKLSKYADLLAAQGSLTTAINYLGTSQEVSSHNVITNHKTCDELIIKLIYHIYFDHLPLKYIFASLIG